MGKYLLQPKNQDTKATTCFRYCSCVYIVEVEQVISPRVKLCFLQPVQISDFIQ